jgi:hypothetical protein
MLIIRAEQMAALVAAGVERGAIAHLRNCIPDICATLSEQELRDIVRWARKRCRRYGVERDYDFFRYLNLMFMFGFEFDVDPQYGWAARTLTAKGLHPSAKIDLLMDHAMVFCSSPQKEHSV